MGAGVRGAKETERQTIKTNAHRLSALQSARMTCIRFWADTEVMKVFHNQPRHRQRRQHHKPRDSKRSTAKRQSQTRERERETDTHTQQDAGMSEGKGSDLDLVADPLPLPVPLSQGVTNLCHIFLCSPRICYTCYTVHTPYAPESPSVYHLYHLPASAVSPRALFEESKSVSDSLSFFLSFFPFFGNHFCGRSTSSIECRGRQRLIHQPRLALLIVDSLQKCATSCSHRRPL